MITPLFIYEFTGETRPFHVFQKFSAFRKSTFKQWSVYNWVQESGVTDQALLSGVLRGYALPDVATATKLYDSMNLCADTRGALTALVNAARQKKMARLS